MLIAGLSDQLVSVYLLLTLKCTCFAVITFLCAHYMACYWYGITHINDFIGDSVKLPTTWLEEQGLGHTDVVAVLYLKSLQWTLAQTGFASVDIYPTNYLEVFYANLVTMFWFLFTAYLFAMFVMWFSQLRDLTIHREKA